MRNVLRQITTGLLLLVIAITSVQFAAARGQAPAVATMEICSGSGPVHILVDEHGEPTGNIMVCPDYATAFFADPTPDTARALRAETWQAMWLSRTAVLSAETVKPDTHARGPPAFV